ncbi:type II toxin-antitoxin system RelE/ParE family toxin [Blastopirellula sediminis]|uniref:type II toxin-antitoxin system RelE/ParE family toxin n=1 Tax=Blastopirellula sediminis TaxID=2894196 RepID=UPI0036F365FA
MSGRVFWDSRAQTDLDSIIDYIAIEQQSPQNADSFLGDVFEKANLYASNPLLGELREDLGPGL